MSPTAPLQPRRPVPFRDLRADPRLREREAWRDDALRRRLARYITGSAAATKTPGAFLRPPGGPPSEGVDSMTGCCPEIGTARSATDDSAATTAPSAVLRPPGRPLSEGVGSMAEGCPVTKAGPACRRRPAAAATPSTFPRPPGGPPSEGAGSMTGERPKMETSPQPTAPMPPRRPVHFCDLRADPRLREQIA